MDFSPETKRTIAYSDPKFWIPSLELGALIRGVMFKRNMFACDRDSKCKYLPIGSSQWLDAPSYNASHRSYGAMAVLNDDRVMVSGGRSSPSGKNYIIFSI